MSIEREFEGETVTDATIEACKELGISRDELEFDVIQEESSGVLGIGSRKAIIRVISKGEKYENKTFRHKGTSFVIFLHSTFFVVPG